MLWSFRFFSARKGWQHCINGKDYLITFMCDDISYKYLRLFSDYFDFFSYTQELTVLSKCERMFNYFHVWPLFHINKANIHVFWVTCKSLLQCLLLFLSSACVNIFNSTSGEISGFEGTLLLDITLQETTSSGTELYTLSWDDDCVEPPIINDDNFNAYFTVNDTEDCMWVVSVNTALIGVPDYPSPQVHFITAYVLTKFIPQLLQRPLCTRLST